jgi:hypothetical protein
MICPSLIHSDFLSREISVKELDVHDLLWQVNTQQSKLYKYNTIQYNTIGSTSSPLKHLWCCVAWSTADETH